VTSQDAAGNATTSPSNSQSPASFRTAANRNPVFTAIGNRSVNEGTNLPFTVSATDPDGDSLTYSATNLPSGATFNSATRQFSWTPGYSQAGTYANVQFTVTDSGTPQLSASESITITVNK
jgi:hypothetical protein